MQQYPQWQNQPTPGQLRRARRLVIAGALLAWATQLLMAQWAQAAPQATAPEPPLPAKQEAASILVVHMRETADVAGPGATVGDVCQLESAGAAALAADGRPLAGLPVAFAAAGEASFSVGVEQVVRVLIESGVPAGNLRVQGPVRSRVRIVQPSPVRGGQTATTAAGEAEEAALLDWAGLRPSNPPAREPATSAGAALPGPAQQIPDAIEQGAASPRPGSLADQLRHDLAQQLRLAPESITLSFRRDAAALAARQDITAAQIRPVRTADLGRVSWTVRLQGREVPIDAEASAVVTRLVAAAPIARGQLIDAGDVISEQARIDRMSQRGLMYAEAVGQEAARPIGVGDVLSPDRLAPRLLVKRGQFVNVRLQRGGIEVRTLARAMEEGALGQSVRVRNETTGEVVHVVITGPQAGTVMAPAP